MPADRTIFSDEQGRGWLVQVQYGHPTPSELGIYAARFECPEAPDEPVRIGFVLMQDIESGDEAALREALSEAEPAEGIG